MARWLSTVRACLDQGRRPVSRQTPGAIGASKELIESTAKVVLSERHVAWSNRDDLAALVNRSQESRSSAREGQAKAVAGLRVSQYSHEFGHRVEAPCRGGGSHADALRDGRASGFNSPCTQRPARASHELGLNSRMPGHWEELRGNYRCDFQYR